MIALGVVLGVICMLAADVGVSSKAWSVVCGASSAVKRAAAFAKRVMASLGASVAHHMWLAEVDCLDAWRFIIEAIAEAERAYQNVLGVRLMASLL